MINIKNVCNIIEGNIDIKPGYLNIKFGQNGLGKSSITKGLEAEIMNKDKNHIIPYGSSDTPTITLDNSYEKVLVFDPNYINNILFKENDTLRDTYEIIVKTEDFEKKQEEIYDLLKNIINFDYDKLDDFQKKITNFNSNFAIKSDGTLSATKKVGKGLKKGNIIDKLADDNPYSIFLKKSYSSEWKKWNEAGEKFYDDTKKCPYCVNEDTAFLAFRKALNDICSNKDVDDNLTSKKFFNEDFLPFLSDDERKEVNLVLEQDNAPTESQAADIKSMLDELVEQAEKIASLRDLKVNDLVKEFQNGNLENLLKTNKIDASVFDKISDKALFVLANDLNKNVDDALSKITVLSAKFKDLNETIAKNVKSNEDYINNFLYYSGMPYRISVDYVDGNYSTIIKTEKSNIAVDNPSSKLSFGEKNSLSLMLFVVDALSSNADLIILDDPISSFDNTKKQAIMKQLFGKNIGYNNLRDKTVLLLTHDFTVVFDALKNHIPNVENLYTTYIKNKNGIVSEKEIKESFIDTIVSSEEDLINSSNSYISKVYHMRKYYELLHPYPDKKENLYIYLSSFLHGNYKPTLNDKKAGKIIDLSYMDAYANEYFDGIDFDYYKWMKSLDNKTIINDYKASTNVMEKLMILRFYKEKNNVKTLDLPLKNLLDQACHIDCEAVYLLNNEFDVVPNHYHTLCDIIAKEFGF